jgi:hypothetical protein
MVFCSVNSSVVIGWLPEFAPEKISIPTPLERIIFQKMTSNDLSNYVARFYKYHFF